MASFVNPSDSYTANTTVSVTCDNGNDQVEWICNAFTGNWDEEPIDCSDQSSGVTCTLPNPPLMASFVNPSDSYTASTTVTVTCDNGNDQAEWICNAFTGNWDEEPIDCSDQSSGVTCTLPNPPLMASFVNPSDSYTASTTVTVTCDNGNDQAEWICNAFTGNWDEEPIDCSDQSSDQPIAIYAGIGGGVSLLVLLLCICACVYWTKRKPQRPSVATPVRSAAPPLTAVYTAGAQPGVVTMPAQAR
ncbi:uncharacterized protein LOC115928563 [Strongylocentrotus purpuratus]|uniref:Sushi domain-containing protein n=1 Tax=Strongylocentrotus purpuratus TaxID=7668 RepID=A0A7M7T3S2_STRPU|nr:uncharacterized protein LOC115928563 [Strongylocentrotus purpuratus]